MKATLTRAEILDALQEVNDILRQKEIRGKSCAFSDTAMILSFKEKHHE
jgi:hypothetical protein